MTWFAVAAPGLDLAPLGQYGAIGVGIVALGFFAWRAYNREVQRSDRLESKLMDVHEVVQERVIPALQESTRSVQDTTELLRKIMTDREIELRIKRAKGE